MQLTDTHCHIQEALEGASTTSVHEIWTKTTDLPNDMIRSAAAAGVDRIICVGNSLADSQLAVKFVQSQPGCWASIGIHPHEAQLYAANPASLSKLASLASQPKVVAVGETGLDYFYQHSSRVDQEKILHFHIELALSHNLPLIFHVREAFADFWPIFDSYQNLRGVVHSFSAGPQQLDEALSRGLYIGLNGIMTFTKDETQLAAARLVPLNKLVLETDAPFLTPTPYRGTINEPKYVRRIAEFLSELRDERLDVLAAATTHNAQELFGLKD